MRSSDDPPIISVSPVQRVNLLIVTFDLMGALDAILVSLRVLFRLLLVVKDLSKRPKENNVIFTH